MSEMEDIHGAIAKESGRDSTDKKLPSSVPALTVETIEGVPTLKGWDQLDQWALYNHARWTAIRRRAAWLDGMSEIDKLRLLAGEMLCFSVELMMENFDMARSSCMQTIQVSDQPTPMLTANA
jgi:hypothetical protein